MSNNQISFAKAIQITENALSEVGRLAVEQIRRGAEASSHIEAAERDLRGALRQLVLAEREAAARAVNEATRGVREGPRGVHEGPRGVHEGPRTVDERRPVAEGVRVVSRPASA